MQDATRSEAIPGSELGSEAWCLCAGAEAERERAVGAFGAWTWARVVAPSLGEPAAWAAAIAARGSSALEHDDMLAASPANESLAGLAQRLLDALERALRDDPARVLLVMPRGLPALLAARALGMPLERAPALWVDPGRAVLLLHGRRGFALRRSNSPHPVADGEESP